MQFATKAKDEFGKVLNQDPNNSVALASLASLAFNEADPLPLDQKMAKLDEAAGWYTKLVTADPKNRDGYYSLGAIAQKKFYPALMTARVDANMKPDEPGPLKDKKAKAEASAKYMPVIDDGVKNLQKALDIDPESDDAMAYMNLLIRDAPTWPTIRTRIRSRWRRPIPGSRRRSIRRRPSKRRRKRRPPAESSGQLNRILQES